MREDWQAEWLAYHSWIKSFFGFFLYHFLRNDRGWALLNEQNKQWVHRANLFSNLERPAYAQPGSNPEALGFDDPDNRDFDVKGQLLIKYLNDYQPESVIEIGPGIGFLTREIINFPSVMHYTGLDINPAFIDFLRPRLEDFAKTKPGFEFDLIAGDFKQESLPPSDSVIFLSAVHHIPDRVELFESISAALKPGGTLYTWDPTHYIPRKLLIFRKFMRGFYGKEFRNTYRSMATHNFCTQEEFERVFREVGDLKIEGCTYVRFEFPPLLKPVLRALLHYTNTPRSPERWFILDGKNHPLRIFSGRMSLVARKQ